VNAHELSEGALYLLTVARENDRHRALERNTALLMVLAFGKELLLSCNRKGPEALSFLLPDPGPQNFLLITAAALHEIRKRIDDYILNSPLASPIRDFDRHALQGFAEALADLTWPGRSAKDFDGPPAELFVSRIAGQDLHKLWRTTLQHYLANIFQDYFAALRIRENVRDLDVDTEANLRLVDARLLADHALRIYNTMRDSNNDPELLALALYEAIDQTLKGRSSL
jgi:hypothetical protein